MRLTDDTLLELVLERHNRLDLVGHHAADRNACPVADHLGNSLAVDRHVHQRLFALQRDQLLSIFDQIGAQLGRILRTVHRRGALIQIAQRAVQGADLANEIALLFPLRLKIGKLRRGLLAIRLEFLDALRMVGADAALTRKHSQIDIQHLNAATAVFHRRGSSMAGYGDAAAGGVEQAYSLVRQLPARDVAA
jgi:hypothetical protein